METTGRLSNIAVSYPSRHAVISFEVAASPEDCEKYRDCDLDLIFKKHSDKRSLRANAYYRQLLSDVASALKVSNNREHNIHLRMYGQPEIIDGQLAMVLIPDTEEAENSALESEHYHIKPTSQVTLGSDGVVYRTYIMLRGSSDYNTKEMSRLIEGLVETAKELGIETLTPDELRKLRYMENQNGKG